jgi:predicted Zn-dependent protease
VLRLVPASVVQKTGPSHEAILRQGLGATDGRVEKLTLGGMEATHYAGPRRDARGRTGTLDATIVSGPRGQVFLLGRVARDGTAMDRARPALREAELSFRSMSDADRVAARPWHLNIVAYPAGGFAQLARSSPLTELPEQQLRLLNGVYGGHADPRPGQLVKVVE